MGIFYNLDEIQRPNETYYEDVSQLYEFYEGQLGEGNFSKVYKAKFVPTGEILAVKVSELNHYHFTNYR